MLSGSIGIQFLLGVLAILRNLSNLASRASPVILASDRSQEGLLIDGTSFDGKAVLVSSFRNEAPFVLEFVAHHKVIGFDEIVIASNDCSDGTTEILDALAAMGAIRHVPCAPPPRNSPQAFAYAQIRRQLPIDRAAWLMILDADELLNIHVGAGRLADLIAAQQADTDLVLVNWACFGNSGHDRWADELSSQRFVRRLRTLNGNGLVKSLIRAPGIWKDLSNHHPYGHKGGESLRIAFAGGLWVEDVAADSIVFGTYRSVKPRVGTFRFAQVNHYATRTEDSFDLRRARGRGAMPQGKDNDRHNDAYFRRMSSGSFLDDTILRYADDVARVLAEYRANPRLAAAVDAGRRLYEAEIARYWQDHNAD
ncbi:MAG: glycosyltransferase family 2 protein [Cypionkella sp.]